MSGIILPEFLGYLVFIFNINFLHPFKNTPHYYIHFIQEKSSKGTFFNTHRVVENNGFILNGKRWFGMSTSENAAATQGHNNSILMIRRSFVKMH